jgi:F-box interacting protein
MYGFGHDPVSGSYKVVVVLDLSDSTPRNLVAKNYVKIRTLGTNFWENIPRLVFPFVITPLQRSGIYHVSGTINWLVKDHLLLKDCPRENHYFVVSLDLRNNSHQEISLPHFWKVGSADDLHLSVFRDYLCMIYREDVWIMKEYGNRESWTKLLTLSYMQDPRTSWVFANAMHIFEDGQVFVKAAGGGIGRLVVYNSRNDSFELPFPSENTVGICIESLISPCS